MSENESPPEDLGLRKRLKKSVQSLQEDVQTRMNEIEGRPFYLIRKTRTGYQIQPLSPSEVEQAKIKVQQEISNKKTGTLSYFITRDPKVIQDVNRAQSKITREQEKKAFGEIKTENRFVRNIKNAFFEKGTKEFLRDSSQTIQSTRITQTEPRMAFPVPGSMSNPPNHNRDQGQNQKLSVVDNGNNGLIPVIVLTN